MKLCKWNSHVVFMHFLVYVYNKASRPTPFAAPPPNGWNGVRDESVWMAHLCKCSVVVCCCSECFPCWMALFSRQFTRSSPPRWYGGYGFILRNGKKWIRRKVFSALFLLPACVIVNVLFISAGCFSTWISSRSSHLLLKEFVRSFLCSLRLQIFRQLQCFCLEAQTRVNGE